MLRRSSLSRLNLNHANLVGVNLGDSLCIRVDNVVYDPLWNAAYLLNLPHVALQEFLVKSVRLITIVLVYPGPRV